MVSEALILLHRRVDVLIHVHRVSGYLPFCPKYPARFPGFQNAALIVIVEWDCKFQCENGR